MKELGLDGVILCGFLLLDFRKIKISDQKKNSLLDKNHPWESAN